MYSPAVLAGKYLRYLIRASNGKGHGIHSPFVFEFVTKVLNDKTEYPQYRPIEKLRKCLLADQSPVPFEDYGARSYSGNISSRSVSSIAGGAAKSPRLAQLLFRMVRHYHPHYVLELGTSLGISTCYLASADPQAVVLTGEGNHVVAGRAKKNFKDMGLHNIRTVIGNFDNTLPQMISSIPNVDLAFIDGNHRKMPTISYFDQLMHRKAARSVFVFDDIHWSPGMEAAWKHIRSSEQVLLSVDLFHFGIVFFAPELKVKQHFVIRF